MDGTMVQGVEDQIQAILRSSPAMLEAMRVSAGDLDDAVQSRILTQPLKRAGDKDEFLMANDPTPQSFDPLPPHWLRPSVSISASTPVAFVTGATSTSNRYRNVRYTLAYYAAPDVARVVLWQMRTASVEALRDQVIWFPDGIGARLREVNDVSSMVPVPEFPGAGMMMIERIAAIGVARRE